MVRLTHEVGKPLANLTNPRSETHYEHDKAKRKQLKYYFLTDPKLIRLLANKKSRVHLIDKLRAGVF